MKNFSICVLSCLLLATVFFFPADSMADLLCGQIKTVRGKQTFKTVITTKPRCPSGSGLILKTDSTLPKTLDVAAISGLQGAQGIQGPSGPQGIQGAPGTTNAIFSREFGPSFNGGSAYQANTLFGINNISFTVSAPEITQDVLDNGIVYVVANLVGYNSSIWPTGTRANLPYTVMYLQNNATQLDTWQFQATAGQIKIIFNNNNNIYTGTGIAPNHRFRYVVIPRQ